MKTKQLAMAALLSTASLFTACGDDVTKVTEIEKKTSGLETVASADSLGKCSEEISGEMKFATKENAVFVCADSAWKNVSQAKKASCSAEALSDSSGFKIVCDGDSIGVLKNGANGTDGKKGDAGKDGASGESCKFAEGPVLEAGSSLVQTSFVVCGKDTVTLSDGRTGEACELADGGDGTVSVVCGETSTTLYKAFCGGKVYDPDLNSCLADSLHLPLCGGKTFNPDSNFCFKDFILPLCNGERYNLDSSVCLGTGSGEKVYKRKAIWHLMPNGDYDVFVDRRDLQAYYAVKIGERYWMVENLNYETDDSYCYDDDSTNCAQYGRLYTWEAAKNACPEGWHLPSADEWDALYDHVAQEVGSENGIMALKMASGWTGCEDGNGTNKFQFSALPAGIKYTTGFTGKGNSTFYWSSTPNSKDPGTAEIKVFLCDKSMKPGNYDYADTSIPISVRCVQN